jgi:hypothetical protein
MTALNRERSFAVSHELVEQYTSDPSDVIELDERDADVLCWRLEQLQRAGYSGEIAYALAEDTAVDLHAACDLIRRGCPARTAYRILV